VDEILNLSLIRKARRGFKKGGLGRGQKGKEEESNSSNKRNIDFNHVKCFKYHMMGHYTFQIPKRKKAKKQQK
jgi:hypothetical protein